MTTPAWPVDILPAVFLREDFRYQRQPAVERTEMEAPAARARLTDRNPLARVPVATIMNSNEKDYFDSWLENEAAYGGAWFTIDLPLSHDENRNVLARIVDEPVKVPHAAAKWRISWTLEIRDTNVISGEVLELIREFTAAGLEEMSASLVDANLDDTFAAFAALS